MQSHVEIMWLHFLFLISYSRFLALYNQSAVNGSRNSFTIQMGEEKGDSYSVLFQV